jgi:sulfonate transport system permease protein
VDVIVGTPLAAIRQVPLFGWIPLIAVAAGIGETSKIVFIVLAAFYPVVLNTTEGLRQAPRELVEVGRVLGYGRWTMLVRVRARHAVPAILTGLKHGLTFAGLATVSAEVFMSAGPGLGNLLEYGQATMRIDLVLVGVLLVGVTTMALNLLVERAERRLLRWRPAPRGGAS